MRDDVEGILGAPDGSDGLVVELMVRDGDKWGEVFRKDGEYLIKIYAWDAIVLDAENVAKRISQAVEALKTRLE